MTYTPCLYCGAMNELEAAVPVDPPRIIHTAQDVKHTHKILCCRCDFFFIFKTAFQSRVLYHCY